MPNLFSKIASQNGKIKLFSGGKQIKSLSPLLDVARCFKFMEKNKFFFHPNIDFFGLGPFFLNLGGHFGHFGRKSKSKLTKKSTLSKFRKKM